MMKEVTFDLGRRQFPIRIPPHSDIFQMGQPEVISRPEEHIRSSLSNPIQSPPLSRIVQEKSKTRSELSAVIVISDNTRPVPYSGDSGILFPLIDELLSAGLTAPQISLLVATGTHHAMNSEELREFLDPRIFSLGIPIHNHDSRDPEGMIAIGRTDIGGEICVSRRYMQGDIRILTGLVESHFMAGASGGRKSICPGLLAEESISILHGARILSSPFATDLVLEGNPVHEESLRVARMAGCDMIVNVTLDSTYRLTGVFAGELEAAHRAAVEKLMTYVALPFDREYDMVITHAGFVGINHYQAAKGALACMPLLKTGGTCIIAASHPDRDPIGGPHYRDMMALLGRLGPERYLETILQKSWIFVPDQWEAQMWARLFMKVPPDNLWYCTFDIPAADFSWLPGRDARQFDPSAGDLQTLTESSLQEAAARFRNCESREPAIAVLIDGPYGIPVPQSRKT